MAFRFLRRLSGRSHDVCERRTRDRRSRRKSQLRHLQPQQSVQDGADQQSFHPRNGSGLLTHSRRCIPERGHLLSGRKRDELQQDHLGTVRPRR